MATSTHQAPPADTDCAVCCEPLSADNWVEYRTAALLPTNTQEIGEVTGEWLPSKMCKDCIEQLQGFQFNAYVDGVAKADCKAALRRYVTAGPPVWLSERIALPTPEEHVVAELWYMADDAVHSAKLTGALEGAARQTLWDHHKYIYEFLAEDPPATASS